MLFYRKAQDVRARMLFRELASLANRSSIYFRIFLRGWNE
jgi:hypothetical protein